MATSQPWSVKGVDPRARDAAKAAARRAGMTLGEWLDHRIMQEAAAAAKLDDAAMPAAAPAPAPQQLDIAQLSERLSRIAQGDMATSAHAATSVRRERRAAPVLVEPAAEIEREVRAADERTMGALDSIARWMERTEARLATGERTMVERQERATGVIAEAIKTMGDRLVEIERRSTRPAAQPPAAIPAPAPMAMPAPAPAAGPVLSRDRLAAAVTDIRSRQRDLDAPAGESRPDPQERAGELRRDLRSLETRFAAIDARKAPEPVRQPEATRADLRALEQMVAELGGRIERLDRNERLDPILKPLARIESEVARLSEDRAGGSFERFELEVAHLAAKVDALATRGGDRSAFAPVLRDIAELRTLVANDAGNGRLDHLSRQVESLSAAIAELRESPAEPRSLQELAHAIEDVRHAILRDRGGDPAMPSLTRQVEALAAKIDALPKLRPDALNAQADQLVERLAEMMARGGVSDRLARHVETLADRLDRLAVAAPTGLEERIDRLQAHIDGLAERGPTALSRQIEALSERVEALTKASASSQSGALRPSRVDMGPVEDLLRGLAEKIDEAGRPGAGVESFDGLERQIAGIARRLDEASATRTAETGIERTLQDLVLHLQGMRQETSAAAERGVRAAMSDLGAPAAGGKAEGLAELSDLVSGLRNSNADAGRQTQDALGAVHRSLDQIMQRLGGLESELAQRATAPATERAMPATAAAPGFEFPKAERRAAAAAAAPVAPPAAPAPRPEPVLAAFDQPLEPGSGRPQIPTAGVPIAGIDPQSIRQNLIAAARRSAKAASDAAAQAPAAEAAPAEPVAKSRLRDIMTRRRKPLLLGLAAIVLAFGAAHVASTALQGPKTGNAAPAAEPSAALARNDAPVAVAAVEQAAPVQPAPVATPAVAPNPGPQMVDGAPVMTLPAVAMPEPVAAVTGIEDLPAGLGTPGVRKAALSGDARAVYELASRVADGGAPQYDAKTALRLFERAAVAGLAPAQFRLGNMFEKGVGTARDPGLARIWYQRAAERGNAKAMHNLAVLLAEGVAGKPDYAGASEWFKRAADHGVRDSQYNLAILLGRGLGTQADLPKSWFWFAVAAAQGDDDAGRKRDELAGRLSATELAAGKKAVTDWRAKAGDPAANEVQPPAKGWDETPAAAVKKPPKTAKL